eukprot:CAMPEP_0201285408 /NCGR_PEP_ID=MMETSP1317-20130820/106915_1 /ASSEMBLY_ACC=CAM_ASM_000770 /TAXON_ID=187299 /ORGANISM="Undescribed Undescribed, Strain Undescribed" /LENGTH=34 /DNA_ID= /DNA_START= /DNA_END= /DNA_ORIENTATION=
MFLLLEEGVPKKKEDIVKAVNKFEGDYAAARKFL